MDPFSNHQNLIDPLFIRDETRVPNNFSELGFPYFDPIDEDLRLWDSPLLTSIKLEQVSPIKQDQNYFSKLGFPYFDPIDEYLRLWDTDRITTVGDDKSLDTNHHNNESLACQVKSNEVTSTTTTDYSVDDHLAKRSRSLALEDIEKYFEIPIARAAKELNVGLTMLKKRCRELNIKRWPHRKLKTLKSLIHNVKEMGLNEEIEKLEEQKRIIEKLPEMEISQRTKKLRQSCFKANYKKRKFDYSPH